MHNKKEIKFRFFYVLFSSCLAIITSYSQSDKLVKILAIPLEDVYYLSFSSYSVQALPLFDVIPKFHLIFTELSEAFITHILVAINTSLYMCIIPLIATQIWWFIKPGLYKQEKRKIAKAMGMSLILWIFNIILTYYLILPAACSFFHNFSSQPDSSLETLLETRIYTYFGSAASCFYRTLFIFQLPLFIWFFVNNSTRALFLFTHHRKLCHLFIALLGSIIAPDFTSQCIMIIPLVTIYEFLVVSLLVQEKRKGLYRHKKWTA